MLMEMPDIARQKEVVLVGALDKVGMTNIEIPLRFLNSSNQELLTPASCDIFVSLDDPNARGIHMSRLYLSLSETLAEKPLSFKILKNLLIEFKRSHESVSQSSYIKINFNLMERRSALKSKNSGWRSYPVEYRASYEKGVFTYEIQTEVIYSSTCPCSAALSRQIIQKNFLKHFTSDQVSIEDVHQWLGSSKGINATPHSQRSHATVLIKISDAEVDIRPIDLINVIEKILKTPVQTVVKREDEQEFARLNGENLMFCEDAGRRVKKMLDQDQRIVDYRVQINHAESLHPHDAVSIVTKGIGYRS